MSLEENKAIVRRLFEAYNRQNLDILDELLAPDFIDHNFQLQGLESFKQFYTQFYKGFPNTHSTIEDIIAEGDKVWTYSTVTGTHKGEYRGLSPTGKETTIRCVDIYRLEDGKIVESWGIYDNMDFYKQIGIVEYTEKGKKLFPEDVS